MTAIILIISTLIAGQHPENNANPSVDTNNCELGVFLPFDYGIDTSERSKRGMGALLGGGILGAAAGRALSSIPGSGQRPLQSFIDKQQIVDSMLTSFSARYPNYKFSAKLEGWEQNSSTIGKLFHDGEAEFLKKQGCGVDFYVESVSILLRKKIDATGTFDIYTIDVVGNYRIRNILSEKKSKRSVEIYKEIKGLDHWPPRKGEDLSAFKGRIVESYMESIRAAIVK